MDIHQRICDLIEQHQVCAEIKVLEAQGSTPLKAGAKAVVEEDGRIWGTIGGGAVEAEAQQRAVRACTSGQAEVFEFQMQGTQTRDREPVCGGTMRVLVTPLGTAHKQACAKADAVVQTRQRAVLVTRISGDTPHQVTMECVLSDALDGPSEFPDKEPLYTCLKTETPGLFLDQATGAEVFVEPLLPRPQLVIAGGGHVGQALAQQAVLVGFDVTVLDDRPEFLQPDFYPAGVRMQGGDMARAVTNLDLTSDTFMVIVTRGHQQDAQVLAACVNRPAGYIGMIGSRRKIAVIRSDMIASGITTEKNFNRVYAPVGLDIGSVTAAEIAASIVAQLIAVRRKGGG